MDNNCRNHTVCTIFTCCALKKYKVKEIAFDTAVKLSKKLAQQSCMNVDSYFIIDVFNTYKKGVDFRNQYLQKGRGKDE